MTENRAPQNPVDSAFDMGKLENFSVAEIALTAAKDIAAEKGKELLERAKKIKPGHLALAVGLGAGAWLLGDKAAEWSMKFANEGQNTIQGFANMMTATAEAVRDPSLTPQERNAFGSFTYALVPLFLGLAGGSIRSGVEALRPAFAKKQETT